MWSSTPRRTRSWGYRKTWALFRFDGREVSPSTVERIMRRRGLLLERSYAAERMSPGGRVPVGPR
jgi:hypothetical protein